jgi:outer membrane receptor protein involved in Fe transport
VTVNQTNSIFYGNHTTWDFALYAEDELKFSPLWTLTIGTRYDFHRVFNISSDQQISPRLGLVYRPWKGNSLRLSTGYGFRAPSIAEVFASTTISGFRVVPNLDLKEAERAWSFEIGMQQLINLNFFYKGGPTTSFWQNPFKWYIEHLNQTWSVDVAFFYSRYRNMIDVALKPQMTVAEVQFVNLGRARIAGVETRIQISALDGHLTSRLGYTLLDPINLDTEKTLNYRSRHRLNTSHELTFWRLTLGLDYRYASRIDEIINILGSGFEERVPMHVMDCRLILDLNPVQIGLEAKNIRNYQYTLRQRFLEPIRHYVVTLRGRF